MRQKLTPSQELWVETFGVYGLPRLDERKVLAILDSLPKRQQQAVRLKFGFGGAPLSFEHLRRVLHRADGRIGVSKELARLEVRKAIHSLRQPSKRRLWQEAEL
jgi:DNA-directed RNA polymerase sigma subunit (sigma70/sigma32)